MPFIRGITPGRDSGYGRTVEVVMGKGALVVAPPTLIRVRNLCLNCSVELPTRDARYCADCWDEVMHGAKRDSFGRIIKEDDNE